MKVKRIYLEFPADVAEKPVVYHLVKDYDLMINILKAEITPKEEGRMLLEVSGDNDNLLKGLEMIKGLGIKIGNVEEKLKIDHERCVDCGSCTAVCLQGALVLSPDDHRLNFYPEKCTMCKFCIPACPFDCIEIEL